MGMDGWVDRGFFGRLVLPRRVVVCLMGCWTVLGWIGLDWIGGSRVK